jgi:hypothetical protein
VGLGRGGEPTGAGRRSLEDIGPVSPKENAYGVEFVENMHSKDRVWEQHRNETKTRADGRSTGRPQASSELERKQRQTTTPTEGKLEAIWELLS